MAKKDLENLIQSLAESRSKTIFGLSGPIPFLGLVVMVCEVSLAISNAFISDKGIQWFLVISMVFILAFSVAGFFHLIINHHKNLFSPSDFPESVVKEIFSDSKQNNTISDEDVVNYIKLVLSTTNTKYTIADLNAVAYVHFHSSSVNLTPTIQSMLKSKSLIMRKENDETFVSLPVSDDGDSKKNQGANDEV